VKFKDESMSNQAAEIFAVELEGWLYGLKAFPGKMYPALVQQVIKELAPALGSAMAAGVEIDFIAIARKFLASANGVITERAIIHHLLVQLPNPRQLNEELQYKLAISLNAVEVKFPGVVSSAQKAWALSHQSAPEAVRVAA
jgi:hypothetical protein